MTRTVPTALLVAILSLGLLGTGDVCSWLCQEPQRTETQAEPTTASHCGGAEPASAPAPEPAGHEACTGCSLDVAAHSVALDLGGASLELAGTPSHIRMRDALPPVPGTALALAERAPPLDVLATTRILLL